MEYIFTILSRSDLSTPLFSFRPSQVSNSYSTLTLTKDNTASVLLPVDPEVEPTTSFGASVHALQLDGYVSLPLSGLRKYLKLC